MSARTASPRDQLAMAALTGILSAQLSRDEMNDLANGIKGGMIEAKAAYALADAMLKARQGASS